MFRKKTHDGTIPPNRQLPSGVTTSKNGSEPPINVLRARQFLGNLTIGLAGRSQNKAVFGPLNKESVAIHETGYYLESFVHRYFEDGTEVEVEMPGLYRLFTLNVTDVKILVRSLKARYEGFVNHLDELTEEVNPAYGEFLTSVKDWGSPRHQDHASHRDLWIIGKPEQLIPATVGDPAGNINGHVVTYQESGPALHALINRIPARLFNLYQDPHNRNVDYHQVYAAPKALTWFNDGYAFGDHRFVTYFVGTLTPQNAPVIFAHDFDVLMRWELLEGYLYVTTLLRFETTRDETGFKRLEGITEMLTNNGNWGRVSRVDTTKRVFRYFLPGSAPIPYHEFYGDLYDDPTGLMSLIPSLLNKVGDPNGTVMAGKTGGEIYLEDPAVIPVEVATGPSKESGKSTYLWFKALQTTSKIWWFELTGAQYERAAALAPLFGGKVWPATDEQLDLRDAPTIWRETHTFERKDIPEIQALQVELHGKDREVARTGVAEFFQTYENYGMIVQTPTVFTGQDTIRWLNLVDAILTELIEHQKQWYRRTKERLLLVFDNFNTIIRTDADNILGSIPADTGRNLGLNIEWLLANGANNGFWVKIATQSREDFNWVRQGMYSLLVEETFLGGSVHQWAQLINPANGEIKVPKLEIRLPFDILKHVERLDAR